jgi:hypothetical protein
MARWETGGFFMRFTIRDLLWLLVVVGLIAMLVFAVFGARSEALARGELLRHTYKSEDQLEHLLAELERESPGTVQDDWDTITVKTKSGKTFLLTLYSRDGRQPWTK